MQNQDLLNEFGVRIPEYYLYLPDDTPLSPRDIAELFEVSEKTARYWFNPGLNHGRLVSNHPTRNTVSGKELKDWLWKRDFPKMMRDKNFLKAIDIIHSK
ncbi:hypothetical protein [Paenibacillus sp. BC26]|uniref:hypothetical protein n=1 Tax=Paenibacillus sp. BC26 TaxID=1881032 RepID=UPI0015A67AF4|nr:hypothetical protein [Paenibacillus sp. BC26]